MKAAPAGGGHLFDAKGKCACGQSTKDDPVRCTRRCIYCGDLFDEKHTEIMLGGTHITGCPKYDELQWGQYLIINKSTWKEPEPKRYLIEEVIRRASDQERRYMRAPTHLYLGKKEMVEAHQEMLRKGLWPSIDETFFAFLERASKGKVKCYLPSGPVEVVPVDRGSFLELGGGLK